MKLFFTVALAMFAGSLLFVGLSTADDKKPSGSGSGSPPEVMPSKEDIQAQQDIDDLVTAARLVMIGDPEDVKGVKDKCPEMLLSAAYLYKRLAKSKVEKFDKPELSGGSGSPVDKELDRPNYDQIADKLIDRAKEIAEQKKIDKE